MSVEEGVWWSLQESKHTNNFDRTLFYKMAGKFMEFESEEETQSQKLQQRNGSACMPLLPLWKLDSYRPSATVLGQTSSVGTQIETEVFIPKKRGGTAQPPDEGQQINKNPWELKSPKKIPPEAVKEYVDNMKGLLGLAESAAGEADDQPGRGEEHGEEDDVYPALGLMSYIDVLCSQEAFVTKVEAVIHPQFLEMLLSPDPEANPLDLVEDLEQEERLTLTQLTEKRLLELKEKVELNAPQSCGVAQMEPIGLESEVSQDSGRRDNQGLVQQELSHDTRISKLSTHDVAREESAECDLSQVNDTAVFTWSQESHKLTSEQSTSWYLDWSHTSTPLVTRDPFSFRETPPMTHPPGLEGAREEQEEALPSLAFLLGSQQRLLPWNHSSSLYTSGTLHDGVLGPWKAFQPLSNEQACLPHPQQVAAKSEMLAPVRDPSSALKRLHSEVDLRGSCRQPLVVTEVIPSLPQKKKA